MSQENSASAPSLPTTCPVCTSNLEVGYVVTQHFVLWDTKEHKWSEMGAEKLIPAAGLTVINTPGARCRGCNLVLFRPKQ